MWSLQENEEILQVQLRPSLRNHQLRCSIIITFRRSKPRNGIQRQAQIKESRNGLGLRNSENLQAGESQSLMQTFNLVPASEREATEAPLINRPENTLLPLWLSYLQDASGDESSIYCIGNCVDIVQQYIGRSDVVDAAVFAVIAGSRAFSSRNEEDIATAHEANIIALQSL